MDVWRLEFAADLAPIVVIEIENRSQNFSQLLRGDVCPTGDYLTIIVEECSRGPSTEVVATVDVGSPVGVDSDRDEAFVDRIDHSLIRIRRLVHDMAPVAPRASNVEKNRLFGGSCLVECLLPPFKPNDLVQERISAIIACPESYNNPRK